MTSTFKAQWSPLSTPVVTPLRVAEAALHWRRRFHLDRDAAEAQAPPEALTKYEGHWTHNGDPVDIVVIQGELDPNETPAETKARFEAAVDALWDDPDTEPN